MLDVNVNLPSDDHKNKLFWSSLGLLRSIKWLSRCIDLNSYVCRSRSNACFLALNNCARCLHSRDTLILSAAMGLVIGTVSSLSSWWSLRNSFKRLYGWGRFQYSVGVRCVTLLAACLAAATFLYNASFCAWRLQHNLCWRGLSSLHGFLPSDMLKEW